MKIFSHTQENSSNSNKLNPVTRRKLQMKTTRVFMKTPELMKKLSAAIIWPLVLYALIQATNSLIYYYQTPTTSSLHISSRNLFSNTRSPNSESIKSSKESHFNHHRKESGSSGRSIFGGKILYAHALQQDQPFLPSSIQSQDGIIELNATNFNSELIQKQNPFPHIKLIEYYVSYCRFCAKFKQSYINLAKEIHEWRNVLRPSAIDVSVSSNSPIAHSWSVETVPTLRIHPPPKPSLASKLDKQLTIWQQTLSSSDLQKSMFNEYNSSNLMLHSLAGVQQYLEKVPLLKLDLLRYIERYVTYATLEENNNKEDSLFPVTWPNLRPVTESSLIELLRNHPRPELFLIIEGRQSSGASASDQSSSNHQQQHEPSLGLQILMELSSSAPRKAVRYVKASENRKLIEDVIAQHKRAISSSDRTSEVQEQVELLNNLLAPANTNERSNTIVLVHIDDSHTSANSVNTASLSAQQTSSQPSSFPFMNIVSSAELNGMATTLDYESTIQHQNQNKGYSMITRAKRATSITDINQSLIPNRKTRSLFSVAGNAILDKMPSERKVELLSKYISQTYVGTSEDREFVRAINRFDSSTEIKSSEQSRLLENNSDISPDDENTKKSLTSIFLAESQVAARNNYQYGCLPDYGDKLKAIRYMLFNEIPRASEASSLVEQQERLNILANLVAVIKAYFPLPDSASIQFLDRVQSYLMNQQTKLLHVINGLQQGTNEKTAKSFDVKAFKQELKKIEAEGKTLPEIKEYKQCTSYPCAVWRLFHTLAAFEYKKLSQIRQPHNQAQPIVISTSSPQHQDLQAHNASHNLSPSASAENLTLEKPAPIPASSSNDQTPVERLVSPPSTTTSLSLTIATPTSSGSQSVATSDNSGSGYNNKPSTEADLPMPVVLVMRDYITTYFSCDECRKNFKMESSDLSLEKIRREPAEFSILWLWETHNRVNKRLSVDPNTNPPERPKIWFPSYQQCEVCYIKPPTFIKDLTTSPKTTSSTTAAATDPTIFHESIDWNRQKVLAYLVAEYTRHPMDNYANLFGYHVPYWSFIIVICSCGFILAILFRCASCYIERQRRHKATLLNGNGAHYSVELQ